MAENPQLVVKLNEKIIRKHLSETVRSSIVRLQVKDSVSSTNDNVKRFVTTDENQFVVCVANQQTAGRGRNGRDWQSPANANIYMSIGCAFDEFPVSELSGLSLSCGVAIARMLELMGLQPGIKWPNDILLNGKKLSGILVETSIRNQQIFVVIGIGMNVMMPDSSSDKIDQPWVDLYTALSSATYNLDRNQLVAEMINSVICCVDKYKSTGFASFNEDWSRFDVLTGEVVNVLVDEEEKQAKVLGLSKNCALRVEMDNEQKVLYAADIKLKLKSNAGN